MAAVAGAASLCCRISMQRVGITLYQAANRSIFSSLGLRTRHTLSPLSFSPSTTIRAYSRITDDDIDSDIETSAAAFARPKSVPYDRALANNVHLIGTAGDNPEIKYLDSGEIVATSSLGLKRTAESKATWFFLEFKGDLAEIAAEHVKKADRIHVGGKLIVDKTNEDKVVVKIEVAELNFVEDVYGTQAASKISAATTRTTTTTAAAATATAAAPRRATAATSSSSAEKKAATEKLWKVFTSKPTDWYDNRDSKRNPKAPDFKHKATGEALWIEGYHTPPWVLPQISSFENKGVLKKVSSDSSSSSPSSPSPSPSPSPSSSPSSSSVTSSASKSLKISSADESEEMMLNQF